MPVPCFSLTVYTHTNVSLSLRHPTYSAILFDTGTLASEAREYRSKVPVTQHIVVQATVFHKMKYIVNKKEVSAASRLAGHFLVCCQPAGSRPKSLLPAGYWNSDKEMAFCMSL